MGASKNFRYQAAAPTMVAADTGVATYYVDNSGVLKFARPGGDSYTAGQVFTNLLSGNAAGTLGGVAGYYVVQGPSGQRLALQAYLLT